jgi:predicted enzyme related to lactoylglutathione lyase
MSIKVKDLAFVCHTVSDIARARHFYEKVLGLKTGLNLEFAPGMWWIEYDVGGVALAISNSQPPGPGGGTSIALEVESLEKALDALKSASVPVQFDIMDFPRCRLFGITSPDGHSIMFHQCKS